MHVRALRPQDLPPRLISLGFRRVNSPDSALDAHHLGGARLRAVCEDAALHARGIPDPGRLGAITVAMRTAVRARVRGWARAVWGAWRTATDGAAVRAAVERVKEDLEKRVEMLRRLAAA